MDFRSIIPNLNDDESIYVFVRSYYLAFVPWMLLGVAMFIMGVIIISIAYTTFPEVQTNPMANNILVVLVSSYFLLIIPFIAVAFIDYYYDLHVVTDRRLVDIDQHSLFVREINELALEEVQDVTSRTVGILGSVFDFGFVSIETSSATKKFEFDYVRHPREITGIIMDLSDQAKQRVESGRSLPVVPTGKIKAVIDNDIYEQIEPLVKIGAITPEDQKDLADQAKPNEADTSEHTIMLGPLPLTREEVTSPANQTQSRQTKETSDDLDIIIDDPDQSKKKKQ